MKTAFIFPGQGAQSVGMGKDLYDNFDVAKEIFDASGVKEVCFNGSEEDLKLTTNTQPAIVATSIAALEALKSEMDLRPAFTAGHSLGEYCAMYASGVLNLEDTFKLINVRALAMSKSNGGSMAAILNPPANTKDILSQADGYVDIANYNSDSQIVITGETDAVKQAGELLSTAGAKRVVPLAVSGAFHSKLMKDASIEFAAALKGVAINDTKIPVVTNVDAQATTAAADFETKMPQQIYSSVYWAQSVQKMVEEGVDTFIEIGPGKVLAGLVKKIAPEAAVYNVYDKASLEALKEAVCLKLH